MNFKFTTYIVLAMLSTVSVDSLFAADYAYKSGEGLLFSWQADEVVGVTTGNVTAGMVEQLKFWTSATASQMTTERGLYAVGYKLKTDMNYYSYFPYQRVEDFDAKSILCSFDGQKQEGNGSTHGLSKYDYQMAAARTTSDACTFRYNRIGSVLRISFHSPKAMNIAQVSLVTDNPTIATSATMDIVSQTVTLCEYESSMTLTTENVSVGKGSEVVLYFMLPAQDLTDTALDVVVAETSGKETVLAKVKGSMLKAGKMYEMPLDGGMTLTAKDAEDFDDDPFAMDADMLLLTVTNGVSTPLAQTSHITIDKDYVVEFVEDDGGGVVDAMEPSDAHSHSLVTNDDTYNIQGMKMDGTADSGHINKGLHISSGKKILRR